MKAIMKVSLLGILLGIISACQDVPVGYLITEYAGYGLDSLIVKYELDATPPVEMPNPRYEMMLNRGYTKEQLERLQIYPTILSGGGEDYTRVTYNIPWVGSSIEGIEGSAPIWCSIKSVTSRNGEADKLEACISVRGDGTISIPVINDVPRGRYSISLNFKNEGYSKDVNDCFTVIVK